MSKVATTGDLRKDILKAVNAIGGFSKVIDKGDRVLLKPNYNTAVEVCATHARPSAL